MFLIDFVRNLLGSFGKKETAQHQPEAPYKLEPPVKSAKKHPLDFTEKTAAVSETNQSNEHTQEKPKRTRKPK